MKLISICLVLTLAVSLSAQSPRQSGDEVLSSPGATLHDATIAAGGNYRTTMTTDMGWLEYPDVKALVTYSKLVVIGTPIKNICRLSTDKRYVQTVYTFAVDTVIRGVQETREVEVATPGRPLHIRRRNNRAG
jgi:hypothetical protein